MIETTPNQPPRNPLLPLITMGVCGAMLVFYIAITLSSLSGKAVTWDEHVNAVGAYMVRFMGDYRVDIEDGALNKWWSVINQTRSGLTIDPKDPLLAEGPTSDNPNWKGILKEHDAQFYITARAMYGTTFPGEAKKTTPKDDGLKYVSRSRQMFALLTAIGGGLLAWFAYKLAGPAAAIIVTALYCFDPNFIAHGGLVKNDTSLAVCLIGMVFALWYVGQRATILNISLLAFALAAAVTVKFSGLLFVFMLVIALAVRAILPGEWIVLRFKLQSIVTKLGAAAGMVVVIGLFTWAFIWMCYSFRYSPNGTGQFDFEPMAMKYKSNATYVAKIAELKKAANGDPKLLATVEQDALAIVAKVSNDDLKKTPGTAMMSLLEFIDDHKLLPNAWTGGLYFTYASTNMRGSFLMGEYSNSGWWYFFPLAMLFKTPTATILAGVLALGGWVFVRFWYRRSESVAGLTSWSLACLLIPAGIYLLSALTTKLNIGLRHMLPLYPLIFLGIAIVFARLLKSTPRFAGSAMLFLLCGLMMECFTSYPNYIAFFNAPSGGSDGGVKLLSDSNIDWGQDLTLLAKWQDQNDTLPLYICYFGMADPSAYGMHVQHLPGSWPFAQQTMPPQTQQAVLAISATNLQGTYLPPELRKYYGEFWKKVDPREILGGSIYLYDWPPRQK